MSATTVGKAGSTKVSSSPSTSAKSGSTRGIPRSFSLPLRARSGLPVGNAGFTSRPTAALPGDKSSARGRTQERLISSPTRKILMCCTQRCINGTVRCGHCSTPDPKAVSTSRPTMVRVGNNSGMACQEEIRAKLPSGSQCRSRMWFTPPLSCLTGRVAFGEVKTGVQAGATSAILSRVEPGLITIRSFTSIRITSMCSTMRTTFWCGVKTAGGRGFPLRDGRNMSITTPLSFTPPTPSIFWLAQMGGSTSRMITPDRSAFFPTCRSRSSTKLMSITMCPSTTSWGGPKTTTPNMDRHGPALCREFGIRIGASPWAATATIMRSIRLIPTSFMVNLSRDSFGGSTA